MHWRWHKCNSAPVSHVLNSLSLTCNSRKQRLRLCQRRSRGYSLVEQAFIHPPWRCWPSRCWPLWASLSNRGRKRPSISWLVENIYDWLVPQRLLTGRAPTGKSKAEQNANDTPSVLVRGYDWDKETERCRLHPDVENETFVHDELKKWRRKLLSVESGASVDPAKDNSEKYAFYMNNCWVIISCLHLDHVLFGLV